MKSFSGGKRRVESKRKPPGERRLWGQAESIFRGSIVFEIGSKSVFGVPASLAGETKDGCSVHQPIYGANGGRLAGEKRFPVLESSIGGKEDGTLVVPGGNETEEMLRCLRIKAFVSEFVANERLGLGVATECPQITSVDERGGEVLEHRGGIDEENGITGQTGRLSNDLRDPCFSEARTPKADDIALFGDELTGAEFFDDPWFQLWPDGKIEGLQFLDCAQFGALENPGDPPFLASVDFVTVHPPRIASGNDGRMIEIGGVVIPA